MSDAESRGLGRIEGLEHAAALVDRGYPDIAAIVRELTARVQRLEQELRQLRGVLESAGADVR